MYHDGLSLCQVWWLYFQPFLFYRADKHTQTDRHTDAAHRYVVTCRHLYVVERDWLTWDARRWGRPFPPQHQRRMTAYKTTASWTPARPLDRRGLALTDAGWRRLAAVDERFDQSGGCQLDRCRQRPAPTSVVTAAARRQHRDVTAAEIPVVYTRAITLIHTRVWYNQYYSVLTYSNIMISIS